MRANAAFFALYFASAMTPALAAPHSLFKVDSLSGPIHARAPVFYWGTSTTPAVAGIALGTTVIGSVAAGAIVLATLPPAVPSKGLPGAATKYGNVLPKGRTVEGYRKYFDPDRTTEGYEKFQDVMTKVRQQFPGDTGITADSVDLTKEAGAFVDELIRTGAV